MTDRELMQQALEALEELLQDTQHADHFCGDPQCPVATAHGTIAALRERLAREERKPVAWLMSNGTILNETTHPHMHTPLYTSPQPREWVGLTDKELAVAWDVALDHFDQRDQLRVLARAIEAALREKNHA